MKGKIQIYTHFLRPLFLFISLLLFMEQSFAQLSKVPSFNPDKHITQFSIDIWDTEQGLPSKSLLYIEQTSDGYLWISSFQGLFRFDGVNFENFNDHKANSGLHSNVIKDIFEKEDGTLCISTSDKGLITYKNGKFEALGYLDLAVQTTLFDSPNHAWIGTKAHGIYELNGSTFTPYTQVEELKDIRISDIFEDKESNIWISTEGKGLVRIDKKGNSTVFTTKQGLQSDKVGTVFQDSQGKIWIGTTEGLCFFENNQIKTLAGAEGHAINRIIEDYYGSLWMASETGILRLNIKTKSFEILNEKNGLPHKNVQDILLDSEGNIWFTMYRAGLGRIKEGKFSNYTNNTGLASKSISAVHELEKNHYLVATDAGVIDRIKDNVVSVLNFKTKLPNDRLKHVNSDRRGNILLSTYSGLLIIAPDGTEKLYSRDNYFPENQVRMTFEDHLGNIWVGTRASGLIKMSPKGVLTFYTKDNSDLSSNFVMSIGQDKKNNLLIGSNNTGLDIINIQNDAFQVTNYKKELTSVLVFDTYTDEDNVIWITTNAGLNRLKNKKITQYKTKNGLPTEVFYDILEDDMGYFWLSSNIGIIRISKEELYDFANEKIDIITTIKIFNKADGMPAKECTGAAFSIKTQDGYLMFPTLGGLTFINPHTISTNKILPPVHIEELDIDNREINIYQKIKIQAAKQRLTFHFTALSLTAPKNISLKYKLEGYDENWTDSEGKRQIVYTGLPHGKYTFKVKAANNDGVWNEEGASLSFEITPRFYETKLFYLVSFLLVALFVYGIYKFRVQSIKKKNEELEGLVLKRTYEINTQKEELLTQKDKIQQQNESLELAYNDVSTLSKIGKEITATLDASKLNAVLYPRVNKLMKADGFGVGIYNKKTKSLDFENYIENGETLPFLAEKIEEMDSLAIRCFQTREIMMIQDLDHLTAYKNISNDQNIHGLEPKALIYLPLLFKNEAMGVVTVQSFETNVYSESDVTILQTLGAYISIALANADAYSIIQNKNELIENKNKLITDSIRYAERIQRAVLPSQKAITDFFEESFVIFSPKDIVSGDFYWFNQVEDKIFIVVGDCTGHGVPGAFMSMIGMASLNEIVNKEHIYSPAEILTALHKKIRTSLKQKEKVNDDGMDIVLCLLEKTENENTKITFSGARRPLYYSENQELKMLKGNRISIGGAQKNRFFTQESVFLVKGESIYLFSDGIIDQHAPNRKRFGTPLFEKMLKKVISKPLTEQKDIITETLKNHQQNMPQRDDIAMIGIRF